MKIFLLSFLFFVNVSTTNWQTDFVQAQADAAKSQKHILLNFAGSDWCAPCIRLSKEYFDHAEFQRYASDHLVLVRADFPRLKKNRLDKVQTKRNEDLAERYNPNGAFPLTVLVDAKGKIIKAWDGFPKASTVSAFIGEINLAIDESAKPK
jgi:thioredoxin-related protein